MKKIQRRRRVISSYVHVCFIKLPKLCALKFLSCCMKSELSISAISAKCRSQRIWFLKRRALFWFGPVRFTPQLLHLEKEGLKGTFNVISSDPLCKDGYARFSTVPLKALRFLCKTVILISTVGELTEKIRVKHF